MSVKKGTANIANVRLGTNEIGKAYLGTNLVFNREGALWVAGANKGMWVSKDGANYTQVSTIAIDRGIVYNNKNIFVADSDYAYLKKFSVDDLRNGVYNPTNTTKFEDSTSYGVHDMKSDGQGTIVVTKNVSDNRNVYYTFDNGQTWAHTNTGFTNVTTKYIGNGRFLLMEGTFNTPDYVSGANGVYYYWDKNHPTTAQYSAIYKLPDNTYPYSGNSDWLSGIFVVEDGTAFFRVKTGSNTYKMYKGSLTQATAEVAFDHAPASMAYAYGMYWATYEGDRCGTLWYSSDGLNWTEKKNGTTDFFYNRGSHGIRLQKNNNKLCFYGQSGCGIINSNFSVTYTSAKISDVYSYTSPIEYASNKFHKF